MYDQISVCLREDATADIERLTVTLPSNMAVTVKGAVTGGDYALASAVVRAPRRDWNRKRARQLNELATLTADVAKGSQMPPKATCGTLTPIASSNGGETY